MSIMENDTFEFLGFSFTTTEALKIIKEINQNIDSPQDMTTLEEFATSCDCDVAYIEWEDYVYNYFNHLGEYLFENITYSDDIISYDDFITTAEIIMKNTKYTGLELKKSFEDLLFDVLLNSKQNDLEYELEEEHNLESELKNRYGYRNIQFCLSEECDSLEVRYERITNKNDVEVLIETYDNLKEDLITSIIEEIKNDVKSELENLTKDDQEVDFSTLSYKQQQEAYNTSISKFKELCYQQPQELKHILIDYKETPLNDYIAVTQNAINNNDDIKLLDKIFQTYKQDEQHRIYNYDLFAFLYYAYSLKISFEHLYNSRLLKSLGVYTFKADRDKPVLKKNKVSLLQDHKINVELSQYKENIYLHNLIEFIQAVNTKHQNKYLLSYLVDSSHNLKASKEFIESLTCKKSFKNVTYENLPQPINTLLLTPSQIAN